MSCDELRAWLAVGIEAICRHDPARPYHPNRCCNSGWPARPALLPFSRGATITTTTTTTIRTLNDRLRQTGTGGRVVVTSGVDALGSLFVSRAMAAVAADDTPREGDDPHGEHDFGAIDVDGRRLFWKIDYYDRALEFGSPDPADPSVTTRVMTVMLADEY